MAELPASWTITISREMGSMGGEIGRQLGHSLGFRVVGHDLINQAARRAGTPEAALAAIDELGLLGMCPSEEACLAYRTTVEQIMQEMANEGNVVIIGRAGQVILSGWPKSLHLRLIAPAQIRTERISRRLKISLDAAHAQITVSDRFRKNYLKRFYNVNWNSPELYDLVVNTAHLDADAATDIVLHSLHQFQTSAQKSLVDQPAGYVNHVG